jgi:hypothetical protein
MDRPRARARGLPVDQLHHEVLVELVDDDFPADSRVRDPGAPGFDQGALSATA